jgi:ribA/ribD-fused uncharacterized protein
MPIYNEANQLFVCAMCDGPLTFQGDTAETIGLVLPVRKSRVTFTKVEMPYAMKLLDQELTTFMNAGLRFLTAKQLRRFREPVDLALPPPVEAEVTEEEANAIEKQIDEGMAAAAIVANLPKAEKGDAGAEDAAEDREDEGAPARNDTAEVQPVPEGVAVIEFYSKTPEYKEFSNFHMVSLNLEGREWPSAEHYFQAMKFYENPEYQETIRKAKTPAVAKRLGKTRDVPIRSDWNTYRDTVMYIALKEKFSERHPELRGKLLKTGDAVLKEASPMDNYWGIGRSKKGKNKMGILLMKVRQELLVPTNALPAAAPSVDADVSHAIATQAEAALPPPPPEVPGPAAAQADADVKVVSVGPDAAPPPLQPQNNVAQLLPRQNNLAPPQNNVAPPPQNNVAPPPQNNVAQPPQNNVAPPQNNAPAPLNIQPPPGAQQPPVLNIQEVSANELPKAEDVKVITLNQAISGPKK